MLFHAWKEEIVVMAVMLTLGMPLYDDKLPTNNLAKLGKSKIQSQEGGQISQFRTHFTIK
jgi:hypothetical protein